MSASREPTSSTFPLAVGSGVEVVAGEGMAPLAMGLACLSGHRRIAAQAILAVRGRFDMPRISASGRITNHMVKLQPSGDIAAPVLIGPVVGKYQPPVDTESTIATTQCARPQPAAVGRYLSLGQEAFDSSHTYSIPQGGQR